MGIDSRTRNKELEMLRKCVLFKIIIFIDTWLCHNNFCLCFFDLEPFARVVGLVKLPSSNNLQVLQYFWAVVQCSFCNDRWKGKAQQEKKYSWTSPLTTATLGTEESDHCREVAVVERLKWESMYGLSVCLSVCLLVEVRLNHKFILRDDFHESVTCTWMNYLMK